MRFSFSFSKNYLFIMRLIHPLDLEQCRKLWKFIFGVLWIFPKNIVAESIRHCSMTTSLLKTNRKYLRQLIRFLRQHEYNNKSFFYLFVLWTVNLIHVVTWIFKIIKTYPRKGTKTIEILSFPSFHARSDVQLFPSVVQGN